MDPKSIALLQRIDSNVEQILSKFHDIFSMAVTNDQTRDQLAVELLSIESHALTIIRLCEDLLHISRNLKESWCLGSMKVNPDASTLQNQDLSPVFDKFNTLTEVISKFESQPIQ